MKEYLVKANSRLHEIIELSFCRPLSRLLGNQCRLLAPQRNPTQKNGFNPSVYESKPISG